MQIVVIGCGKVGSRLAQVMALDGNDVVIVDSNRASFKKLNGSFNGMMVAGVPIDQDVLKHAGIMTADALAAVTPDDNVNIMASQIAQEIFKVPKVIARIYNPEREDVFHHFGLETICPTNITAALIRQMIYGDSCESEHTIAGKSISFKSMKPEKKDEGKRLSAIKTESGTMIFGIISNEEFSFTDPNYRINMDDTIIVAEIKKCI